MPPIAATVSALQAMQPLPRAVVRNVFELIAPCWVGPEAALSLDRQLSTADGHPVHLTLNAERPEFTPRMYLQRASGNLLRASGEVIDLTTVTTRAGIQPAAVEQSIRRALLERLGSPGTDPADPGAADELRRVLEFRRSANRATLVAIKAAPARVAALRTQMAIQQLPGVTVIALTGPSCDMADPHLLRPELLANQEATAFEATINAERIVETLASE